MLTTIKTVIKKLPGIRAFILRRDQLRQDLSETRLALNQARTKLHQAEVAEHELKERLSETSAGLSKASSERDIANEELGKLRAEQGFSPAGHFYSPIPCLEEIRKQQTRIFGEIPREIAGIDMNPDGQLELLGKFTSYYRDMPFEAGKKEGLRYYFENPAYSYSDAIFLHCMIRHTRPRRIIEVGSGFSSCMMLDTNELYFDGKIESTFIEPYPELLESLVRETDQVRIIPDRLQDVDLRLFDTLKANDILFIDSTHVSKIDSDVNRIIFDILPRLAPGVYIHFHDIFYPFEYPKDWVLEGRAWNEAYLLRAFLEFNSSFRVILMNTYLSHFHQEALEAKLPLCLRNTGASIWLRKTEE